MDRQTDRKQTQHRIELEMLQKRDISERFFFFFLFYCILLLSCHGVGRSMPLHSLLSLSHLLPKPQQVNILFCTLAHVCPGLPTVILPSLGPSGIYLALYNPPCLSSPAHCFPALPKPQQVNILLLTLPPCLLSAAMAFNFHNE